jgi:hypothetical protein
MPDITVVVHHFFTLYIPPDDFSQSFSFEKRPDGWYIRTYRFEDKRTLTHAEIFWDKKLDEYTSLNYPHRSSDTTGAGAQADKYLRNVDTDAFRKYPYAGYVGWERDNMQRIGAMHHPGDSLLAALAGASVNYAIGFLFDPYDDIENGNPDPLPDPDTTHRVLPAATPVPYSRVRQFLHFERQALDIYRRLGHKKLTAAYEGMLAYTSLRYVGYDREAQSFLDSVAFPDSLLAEGRAVLDGVRKDGALFTSGDSVTYPILYLQARGIRPDVVVIDYDKLSLRRVVGYLDHRYGHTLFTADSATYMKPSFDMAMFQQDMALDRDQRADSFLLSLYVSADMRVLQRGATTSYYSAGHMPQFYTRNVYFDIDTAKATAFYGGKKVYDQLYLHIGRDVLFIRDILLLDILEHNLYVRHVYFSFLPEEAGYRQYLAHPTDKVWEWTPVIREP